MQITFVNRERYTDDTAVTSVLNITKSGLSANITSLNRLISLRLFRDLKVTPDISGGLPEYIFIKGTEISNS